CSRRLQRPPTSTLFPYTTLFRSDVHRAVARREHPAVAGHRGAVLVAQREAGLEVTVPVPGGLGVGPDGQAERLVGVAHRPEGLRSEEHTSELQSRENLGCRLLLE